MGKNDGKKEREERLAAKLRENLRRRKAQARAKGCGEPTEGGERGLSKAEDEG